MRPIIQNDLFPENQVNTGTCVLTLSSAYYGDNLVLASRPTSGKKTHGCLANKDERAMLQHHDVTPAMTSIAELLTQKQHLLSRLEEYPGPSERAEIERLLDRVDAELNALDRPDRL